MKQNNDSQPVSVAVTTPAQQAGEARLPREPWWWVERGVWTERLLTRLTSGESADRVWFRLWDKTDAPANLSSALHKVWKNGGSAGADEQTVAHFGRRAEEELQRLHEQLRSGTFWNRSSRRSLPSTAPASDRGAGPRTRCSRQATTGWWTPT